MLRTVKNILLTFAHRLGYIVIQKSAFAKKITESDVNIIKQEWLDEVVVQ